MSVFARNVPTTGNEKRQCNFHFIKIKPRDRKKSGINSHFSAYLTFNKTPKIVAVMYCILQLHTVDAAI